MVKQLWQRQAGESDKAFEAFTYYRDLGPQRSLDKLRLVLPKNRALLGRWSAKWAWVDRCTAYDDSLDDKQLILKDNKVDELATDWSIRQTEHRAKEWELSQALLAKAEQMLQWPIAQVENITDVYPDGKTKAITIIKPSKWGFRDASALIQQADVLARLASGLPGEVTAFLILLANKGIDPRGVFTEMLAEFSDIENNDDNN